MFYLFERAHVRDLRRISHPLERYDEIIYFDRASLVRRITLADALIWFHDHRRALPPLMRAVIAASAQFPENNPGTLLALPPPTPPPLALPAPAQSTITFQPALLSDRRPGRPRLQTYKSLRRTKLVTAWRLAKSQHISRSDFCAHRGIEIADLARAINWATKRRSRDNKHFLDRLHV
jgi:hypothetical protein